MKNLLKRVYLTVKYKLKISRIRDKRYKGSNKFNVQWDTPLFRASKNFEDLEEIENTFKEGGWANR